MLGFTTLKDILEIIVIPIAILLVGWYLPIWWEKQKVNQRNDDFMNLIRRELAEMRPYPETLEEDGVWWRHLRKRFIQEKLFNDVVDNRDFILSLDPNIAYHEFQLWMHMEKAMNPELEKDLEYHAGEWQWHLGSICKVLDQDGSFDFTEQIYKRWVKLLSDYYPDSLHKMDPLQDVKSNTNY